jgi:hypothetical protein
MECGKSLLHIHVLTGTRPERITCFLYGRFIAIMMLMQVCSYAAWYASGVGYLAYMPI